MLLKPHLSNWPRKSIRATIESLSLDEIVYGWISPFVDYTRLNFFVGLFFWFRFIKVANEMTCRPIRVLTGSTKELAPKFRDNPSIQFHSFRIWDWFLLTVKSINSNFALLWVSPQTQSINVHQHAAHSSCRNLAPRFIPHGTPSSWCKKVKISFSHMTAQSLRWWTKEVKDNILLLLYQCFGFCNSGRTFAQNWVSYRLKEVQNEW